MNIQDDKAAVAKGLRSLADQVEMADYVSVEFFDAKANVERDFLVEQINPNGYMKFAPTGTRHISLIMSYHLPPPKSKDSEPPPIGADW